MALTRRQLYDRRDPTRAEMVLVRAGHYLWHQRRKSPTVDRDGHITAALELIWECKRQVRVEIQAKSTESFKRWRHAEA